MGFGVVWGTLVEAAAAETRLGRLRGMGDPAIGVPWWSKATAAATTETFAACISGDLFLPSTAVCFTEVVTGGVVGAPCLLFSPFNGAFAEV